MGILCSQHSDHIELGQNTKIEHSKLSTRIYSYLDKKFNDHDAEIKRLQKENEEYRKQIDNFRNAFVQIY